MSLIQATEEKTQIECFDKVGKKHQHLHFFHSFQDSDSSDEDMASFLDHHRRAMSAQRERDMIARENVMRDIRRKEK